MKTDEDKHPQPASASHKPRSELHQPPSCRKAFTCGIGKYGFISEFHFHRIFSSVIGESIGVYITRLRLETAAQMLSNSNASVTEVAESCGYQSLHAFSKAFKKYFGTVPSADSKMTDFSHQIHNQFYTTPTRL